MILFTLKRVSSYNYRRHYHPPEKKNEINFQPEIMLVMVRLCNLYFQHVRVLEYYFGKNILVGDPPEIISLR